MISLSILITCLLYSVWILCEEVTLQSVFWKLRINSISFKFSHFQMTQMLFFITNFGSRAKGQSVFLASDLLACCAGILLGRVMFDLEVEWTASPPSPLSLFVTVNRPLNTNFFLSPAFRCH